MGTFSATIKDWAAKSEEEVTTSIRKAVEDTVNEIGRPLVAGGAMPVDTGFLRNSMAAEIGGDGSFATVKPKFKGDKGSGAETIGLVIEGMEAGAVVNVAWTAAYAARVNYGFTGQDSLGRNYNQGGAHFFETGAAKWPDFVDRAVKRNAK